MKVEKDVQKKKGQLLNSFTRGDCIRLVDDVSGVCLDRVYIAAAAPAGKLLAINLEDGCYREAGRFVLEPRVKVVIE